MRKPKVFLIGIVIAALMQTGALAWMVKGHFDDLERGGEIVMQTTMRDPRDFFRGHYTRINLSASQIDSTNTQIESDIKRGPAYLVLKKSDHFWEPQALVKSRPKEGVYLAVKVTSNRQVKPKGDNEDAAKILKIRMDLGISRYYAPKKRALDLEDRNREGKLGLILSVLPNGKTKVKGVSIDEKLYYDR